MPLSDLVLIKSNYEPVNLFIEINLRSNSQPVEMRKVAWLAIALGVYSSIPKQYLPRMNSMFTQA